MVFTVRHRDDGAIYYVTEAMYKDAKGMFILVNEEKTIAESPVKLPTEASMLGEEERVERLKDQLRKRNIVFHPNCSEKTLLKKLNGGK